MNNDIHVHISGITSCEVVKHTKRCEMLKLKCLNEAVGAQVRFLQDVYLCV